MRLVLRLDVIDDDGNVSRKCVAKVRIPQCHLDCDSRLMRQLQVFKTAAARAKDYLNEALTQVPMLECAR